MKIGETCNPAMTPTYSSKFPSRKWVVASDTGLSRSVKTRGRSTPGVPMCKPGVKPDRADPLYFWTRSVRAGCGWAFSGA